MLGALPLALACMAQVLPEEIAGFVDPAFPQFDAVKHQDRDSLARGPVLVHPCSFAACLNDHDLAGRGLTRAEAHARCGEEVGGGLRQGCAPTVREDPASWQRRLALVRHASGS